MLVGYVLEGDLFNGGLRGPAAERRGEGFRGLLLAKPFPNDLGLSNVRLCNSGLKEAEAGWGRPGRGTRAQDPRDTPLRAGPGAEILPGAPQPRVGDGTPVPTWVPTCPGAHLAACSEAAAG